MWPLPDVAFMVNLIALGAILREIGPDAKLEHAKITKEDHQGAAWHASSLGCGATLFTCRL